MAPEHCVSLTVSDTGIGMDAETQARAFEPLFTTKEFGRGTGLGLSTAFGVVRQSGGAIALKSEPGRGTTVTILLPADDPADAAEPVTASRPIIDGAHRGTETVLLVENDPAVRTVARTILRRAGYQVLAAENAGEALLICEQTEGRIELLLTDIVMPRVNGRQLARRLATLRPEMKVLFMSAYASAEFEGGEPDEAFLPKPITPVGLLQKVRETLG